MSAMVSEEDIDYPRINLGVDEESTFEDEDKHEYGDDCDKSK